ncbi:CAP domain-containing protein [Planctomicrobium piriforme]|uniref:Cysteine-rich secretory protein family protein n=1 Tax=Planctomicrobium piriforme TaxID=1576369 RepID=A0A1I3QFT3_9PLAN|nr:CAP domain-containing protein [Planctomicrobium piriforme]SFJ32352.1 Cysteine-rich secretory protein family protein [Planctomicrobium piriforme]
MMKVRLLALISSVLLLAAAPSVPLTQDSQIQAMYAAANKQRAQYGLPVQNLDEALCQTAQRWAQNMAARESMYHGGGEQIIAMGYPNAEACIQGWIYSPGHRVWVLGRNGSVGFGAARSASGRMFYAGVYR